MEGDHRKALQYERRRTCPQKATAAKRFTTEGAEADHGRGSREASEHGGRRACPWKGIAGKRSMTKGVEPVPWTGLPRIVPPLLADARKGTAAKHSTTDGVEPVPERDNH